MWEIHKKIHASRKGRQKRGTRALMLGNFGRGYAVEWGGVGATRTSCSGWDGDEEES